MPSLFVMVSLLFFLCLPFDLVSASFQAGSVEKFDFHLVHVNLFPFSMKYGTWVNSNGLYLC